VVILYIEIFLNKNIFFIKKLIIMERIEPHCRYCNTYDLQYINEHILSYSSLNIKKIAVYKCNICEQIIQFIKYINNQGITIFKNNTQYKKN